MRLICCQPACMFIMFILTAKAAITKCYSSFLYNPIIMKGSSVYEEFCCAEPILLGNCDILLISAVWFIRNRSGDSALFQKGVYMFHKILSVFQVQISKYFLCAMGLLAVFYDLSLDVIESNLWCNLGGNLRGIPQVESVERNRNGYGII